jgi:hypothetical protein
MDNSLALAGDPSRLRARSGKAAPHRVGRNSAYKKLENEWADWIRNGHEVAIQIEYVGTGVRPDKVTVSDRVARDDMPTAK